MDKPVEKVTTEKETAKTTLSRRGLYTPWFFSMMPKNFFTVGPYELMRQFTDEMDKTFADFGFNYGAFEKDSWKPALEIFEREGSLIVRAELPGMGKEDVKVELTDNKLIIHGERKRESKEEKKDFYRSEISYGEFYRVIPLPEHAKLDAVQATYLNGVLEVTVPVPKAEVKRREISIGETIKEQPVAAAATKG